MRKTKIYRHGTTTFTAYSKSVGNGFEVGINFKGKPIFWGNFALSKDANSFWTELNKQVKTFGQKFRYPEKTPANRYCKFLAHHCYSHYYKFVNRVVPKHGRNFETVYKKDLRQWNQWKKDKDFTETKRRFLKAA